MSNDFIFVKKKTNLIKNLYTRKNEIKGTKFEMILMVLVVAVTVSNDA